MPITAKTYWQFLLVIFLWLIHSTTLAQNEIAKERSSLRGIEAMGFTVNVETNDPLTGTEELQVTSLIEMGKNQLLNNNIRLIPDDNIQRSDEIPFLHLHINSMDAGQGIIPFSLSLYFYQPVKLTLNRDVQTSAVTWESGSVGVVSHDQLNLINNAAKNLIEEFIVDYNRINRTN